MLEGLFFMLPYMVLLKIYTNNNLLTVLYNPLHPLPII